MVHFIYILKDPITSKIRYVGKSNEFRIGKRLIEHCRYSTIKYHTHKNLWIKSLLRVNLRPILEIIESCTDDNFREREQFWVQHYLTSGCKLTNATKGGEGVIRIHNRKISDEQRANISATLKYRYRQEPSMLINCSNAGKKTRGIKRKFTFEQSSMFVGVSYRPKHDDWRAYGWMNGKQKHIGLFPTEEAAIEARILFDNQFSAQEKLLHVTQH